MNLRSTTSILLSLMWSSRSLGEGLEVGGGAYLPLWVAASMGVEGGRGEVITSSKEFENLN